MSQESFDPTKWVGVVVILCAAAYWNSQGPVETSDGPLVREIPAISVPPNPSPWSYKNFTFTPVAQIAVRARVLSRERYYLDQPADISPIDLALGWRAMSDNTYLKNLKISQGGRWYFFEMGQDAIPAGMISDQSKNVHIVPSRPAIWQTIKSARPGHVVRIEGSLVDVYGPDAFRWKTYRTIGGTGQGSCWILWVEHFVVED